METITLKGHWWGSSHRDRNPAFCTSDMTSAGWVKLSKEVEIIIELLPHEERVASEVATLDREIQDTRVKAHAKIAELTQRMQDLMALPPPAESSPDDYIPF